MDDLTPPASLATLVFSHTPAAPAAATPAPTSPPAPTVAPTAVEPHPKADVSSAEALKMQEWLKQDLEQGRISPEEAAKAFDQLNATAEQRAPDTRSDEAKALDTQFPPAKQSDYTIRYFTPGQDVPNMTPELKAFDTSARTWLSAAGLPRESGNSLVNLIGKTAQATKDMTADQLDSYGADEYAKLQRVYGDKLEERLQAAGRMVVELDAKTPGLKNLLKSKGIGDTALIASMLIQHAEIFHARRKA